MQREMDEQDHHTEGHAKRKKLRVEQTLQPSREPCEASGMEES